MCGHLLGCWALGAPTCHSNPCCRLRSLPVRCSTQACLVCFGSSCKPPVPKWAVHMRQVLSSGTTLKQAQLCSRVQSVQLTARGHQQAWPRQGVRLRLWRRRWCECMLGKALHPASCSSGPDRVLQGVFDFVAPPDPSHPPGCLETCRT